MFKQKKTFSTIIVFYIFIQLCFSQVSIGGITVQNANSTNSETIETKYGKFTTKAGFPVLRYESGAIKSFYIEDFGYPTTFAKFYHPIYKVEIIVADNGDVINKEVVTTIFEPFAKGDESRSGGKGTGLGLAISNLIVEKHRGRLYIDDSIEGYTKGFVICLKGG